MAGGMERVRDLTQPSPDSCTTFSVPTQDIFHCQIMDGNLSRNLETYLPLIGRALLLDWLLCDQGGDPPPAHQLGMKGFLSLLTLYLQKAAGRAALGTASHFLRRSYPDSTGARAARARQPRGAEFPLHL